MIKISQFGAFLKSRCLGSCGVFRSFMSGSFQCTDSWNKRLDNNLLKKVKLDDLFYEIDAKFNRAGKISAVDVDIFSNSINDKIHLEELEEVVHRFRLTSDARKILDSTHHAFIRAFHSFGNHDELIKILSDRLNYGIFPDDYCNILLMDHFIKENNFTNAARIASLQMLQEDFSNPVVKYLSLYSCHKYLHDPGTWKPSDTKKETENVEEDEEVKVRVKYLRNPYFDDHFDLTDPYSLIGKTFKLISEVDKDTPSNNYHLLGLILHKKWPEAINFSNDLLSKNDKIYGDIILEIEKHVQTLTHDEDEKGNEVPNLIENIKNNLVKFKSNNLIIQDSLIDSTEKRLCEAIKETEKNIIEAQCQVYSEWENVRERVLLEELEEMRRLERIESVKLKKEELKKKEQELFFFDIEDELDLKIENKRVRYPPKWLGKKKRKRSDTSEYLPPSIEKQYHSQ